MTPDDAFLEFTSAVLPLIESWASTHGVPHTSHDRTIYSDSGYEIATEEFDDYWGLIRTHILEIQSIEAARKCVEVHLQEDIFMYPTDGGIPITSPYESYAARLVVQLLKPVINLISRHGFKPVDQEVIDAYLPYKNAWSMKAVTRTVLIPLLNITTDVDEEVTIGQYKFSKLTNEEKNSFWGLEDLNLFRFFSSHDALQAKCKLLKTYDQERLPYSSCSSASTNDLWIPFAALRLLKSGDVGAPCIFYGNQFAQSADSYRVNQCRRKFVLQRTDIPELKRFTKIIECAREEDSAPDLLLAINRFHLAYSRESDEDRIIDLTIALECTLLCDVNNELRYRLSMRGAALLAGSHEPQETNRLLRDMYDSRSKIVHSGKRVRELKISTARLQEYQDIVRDTLKQYLHHLANDKPVKQVAAELDKRILVGMKSFANK